MKSQCEIVARIHEIDAKIGAVLAMRDVECRKPLGSRDIDYLVFLYMEERKWRAARRELAWVIGGGGDADLLPRDCLCNLS